MKEFEVIIIGGSFAGSSAALTLGRSIRKTLIIDAGKPANRFAVKAHNLISHDHKKPEEILQDCKADLEKYTCVSRVTDTVSQIEKIDGEKKGFQVFTTSGKKYTTQKIMFTTGLLDLLPPIPGFAECWGKSVIHCPYCDGYEHRDCKTALIADGELALEMIPLISSWTKNLTLITNGTSSLKDSKIFTIENHNIPVIEKKIIEIEHQDGIVQKLIFEDGKSKRFSFIYARPPHSLHDTLASDIECKITSEGRIYIDENHKTSVEGIYAAGDNSYSGRSLAQAIANGSSAAMSVNGDLLKEEYEERISKKK
ncbi:NAD(P)/FAD-dependent oxidoreductase [Candidatus Gracilibacteria bacterium]|nr:NAD(P)/FAD-dependent oxidoreductase [Candidatus Gracilibacteria bacterium]